MLERHLRRVRGLVFLAATIHGDFILLLVADYNENLDLAHLRELDAFPEEVSLTFAFDVDHVFMAINFFHRVCAQLVVDRAFVASATASGIKGWYFGLLDH